MRKLLLVVGVASVLFGSSAIARDSIQLDPAIEEVLTLIAENEIRIRKLNTAAHDCFQMGFENKLRSRVNKEFIDYIIKQRPEWFPYQEAQPLDLGSE